MEAFREAIVAYFNIRKQKVVWILKCREQHEEAAGNVLSYFFLTKKKKKDG
jgi:hypothetical protein